MSEFNLQEYMSNGVANVIKSAVRATLKNPKEAIFMAEFAMATKQATEKRVKAALLAPTAVNQQKFKIERDGEKIKITAPGGMLTKMDLGIVKCNCEYAIGRKID